MPVYTLNTDNVGSPDFTSIAAFDAAIGTTVEADLSIAGKTTLNCSGVAEDVLTAALTLAFTNTSSSNNFELIGDASSKLFDASKYKVVSGATYKQYMTLPKYSLVDAVQYDNKAKSGNVSVTIQNSDCIVRNCIFVNYGYGSNPRALQINYSGAPGTKVYNNLFYSDRSNAGYAVYLNNSPYSAFILNNTIHGFLSGVYATGISGTGPIIKNNVVVNCNDAYHVTDPSAVVDSNATSNASETLGTNWTYNVSVVDGVDFVVPSAGDFSLTSISSLIGVGIDLSTDFTTDFEGDPRGASWDIGFDQYVNHYRYQYTIPDFKFLDGDLMEGRKPTGAVEIDWEHPISRIFKKDAMVIGPWADRLDLLNNYQYQLGNQTTLNALKIEATQHIDNGVKFAPTDFSFHGANELTIITVVDFSLGNFQNSAGTENEFFRQTTASGSGIAFAGMKSTQNIRSLIYTNGTYIWTAAQDQDISAYKNGFALIAMTWDGSSRHLYAGLIGGNADLLRSDNCSGSIIIQDDALSKSTVCGGDHVSAVGPEDPVYLTILSKTAATNDEVSALCKDPYQFLKPTSSPLRMFQTPASGSDYVIPDARFEMPELFEPRRKPTGNVMIDPDHPLAANIGFLAYPDLTSKNLVDGLKNIAESGATEVTSPQGKHLRLGTLGDYQVYENNIYNFIKNDLTIVVDVALDATQGVYAPLFCIPSRKTGWSPPYMAMNFTRNGTGSQARFAYAAQGSTYYRDIPSYSGYLLFDEKYHQFTVTRIGGEVKFYRDGNLYTTASAPINDIDFNEIAPINIGTRSYLSNNANENAAGNFRCVGVFNKGLTPDEVESIYQNQYQFLIPE